MGSAVKCSAGFDPTAMFGSAPASRSCFEGGGGGQAEVVIERPGQNDGLTISPGHGIYSGHRENRPAPTEGVPQLARCPQAPGSNATKILCGVIAKKTQTAR